MHDLLELQATGEGQQFLEEEQIYSHPDAFLRALRPPSNGQTNGQTLPVYTHQQVYLDYANSVVAKVVTLRDLCEQASTIRPDFVWIDTDRSGSDQLTLRLYLQTKTGASPVRFAPANCERSEPRFITMDPQRVQDAWQNLERLLYQSLEDRAIKLARLDRLMEAFGRETNEQESLATFNRRMTRFLFGEVLGFEPNPVMVSGLIQQEALRLSLEAIINQREEFVAAYNTRIAGLRVLNVDSHLKPLADDYLPLFMTCSEDGSRLRLRISRKGGTQFACATSRSGVRYSFGLGRSELTLDALDEQIDWSPDVTLPILINDNYSGLVAGKSSGLYMMVLNHVMRSVLDKKPIPVLVPNVWSPLPAPADSLVKTYLAGGTLKSE